MDPSAAQLHLEIELGSDPIAGLVSGPHGEARRFSGWIELTEVIEHARATRVDPGRESVGPQSISCSAAQAL